MIEDCKGRYYFSQTTYICKSWMCVLYYCGEAAKQAEWIKIKCVNFVNQVFFILATGNLLVNETDVWALVGPTVTDPVQDPLSVTCFKNGL